MIKLFIFLFLFVTVSANTYPDVDPSCPNVKDSILYQHRLDLVKCSKNTLRDYIKHYNCCVETKVGCYMLFNAFQLVDPTDLQLCHNNSGQHNL